MSATEMKARAGGSISRRRRRAHSCRGQELESVIIAARNAKLKEEKEAALRNAKKGASLSLAHARASGHAAALTRLRTPALSKGKPTLSKASLEGDLDDVRYTSASIDDDYDFM